MLYDELTKYELIFNRNIGACKTKPAYTKLQPGYKPYH